MTVYHVHDASLRNRAKSVAQAAATSQLGDTIKLGGGNIRLDETAQITKDTYIEGNKNTQLVTKEHLSGLMFFQNAHVEIKQVDIRVAAQSNGIASADASRADGWTGSLLMDHITTIQAKAKQKRDYYPTVNIAGNPTKITISDSKLDSICLNVPNSVVTIDNCDLGSFEHAISYINAKQLIIHSSKLRNLQLITSNDPNIPAADIEGCQINGQLFLSGKFKFDTNYFVAPVYKRKLPKQLEVPTAFVTINDNSNVEFFRLTTYNVDPNNKLAFPLFGLMNATTLIAASTLLPQINSKTEQEMLSVVSGGSLSFENSDDSSNWLVQNDAKLTAQGGTSNIISNTVHMTALDKMNQLIGLASAKNELNKLADTAKINVLKAQRGQATDDKFSMHMLFLGNPGTGKTTVARLFGQALYEAGVLKTNTFVESTTKDYIAEIVGGTAPKTHKKVMEALDGVLFIDEAYGFNTGGGNGADFGAEAVQQLLQDMENYRDRLVVILAGYTGPMNDFLKINPGLSSRIPNRVTFDDYSVDEILQILDLNYINAGYYYDGNAIDQIVPQLYTAIGRDGNGRWARNFTQMTIQAANMRLANFVKQNPTTQLSDQDLATVTAQDISDAAQSMITAFQTEHQ